MPTAWNRTPEEFHKIYVANTDAFYRVGSIALSAASRSAMSTWPTRSIPATARGRPGCSGR